MERGATLAVAACDLCATVFASEQDACRLLTMTVCWNCNVFLDNFPRPRANLLRRTYQERRWSRDVDDGDAETETDVLGYLADESFDEAVEVEIGMPPASLWFVHHLERVVVAEEDVGGGGLTCAVCKESVCAGEVVNRLPCRHQYHPGCIVSWLNVCNTCPLCRHVLPADDGFEFDGVGVPDGYVPPDYNIYEFLSMYHDEPEAVEEGGYELPGFGGYEVVGDTNGGGMESQDGRRRQGRSELPSGVDRGGRGSEIEEARREEEGGGGKGFSRWLFVGAPFVGFVGVALVLWLGGHRAEESGRDAV